jgi:hypothetical protein
MNVSPLDGVEPILPTQINYNVGIINNDYAVNGNNIVAFHYNEAFMKQVLKSLGDLGFNIGVLSNSNSITNKASPSSDNIFVNIPKLTIEQALYNFVHSLQNILGTIAEPQSAFPGEKASATYSSSDTQVSPTPNGYDNYLSDLYTLIFNPGTINNALRFSFNDLVNILQRDYSLRFTLTDFLKVMVSNVPNSLISPNDSGSIFSSQV